MAEDTKYENKASIFYNDSAGYMPGEPKPPSGARWFGVSKYFIETNFGNGLNNTPTGKYEKSYLSNNYAESFVEGSQVLFKEAEASNGGITLEANSDVEPIFQCTSFGWGELRENYGLAYDQVEGPATWDSPLIASDVNPTTVAAKRALVNAIMSMFANEQFFLYMLSKGYVYKDIKPLDDELPKSFITKIKEVANSFDIPSRYVEQVEYYKETTTPIINAFGEEDILPDAEKIIRDILHPDDNPSYGTEYDPSSELSPEEQKNAAGFYESGFMGGFLEQDELFKPQNQNNKKPDFVLEWSAIFYKDEPTEATDKETGEAYSGIAPVYEGSVKINADLFISVLESKAIIELDFEEAIKQYASFIAPEPKFNIGTGETSVVSGISLPGAANDSNIDESPPVLLNKAIKEQEIAQKLADSLAVEESAFQIGTIYPGATHYINDVAAKKINSGTVEEKAEYASYLENGKIKVQRVPKLQSTYTALTLEYGSTIRVVDEFITSRKGKYHKVQVVNPDQKYFGSTKMPLFIPSELLTKLEGQLPSAPTLFLDYERSKKPTIWRDFDDETTFFDSYYQEYSVVIEPVDPVTGDKITSLAEDKCSFKVEDLEPAVIRQGIEALYRCYNKSPLFPNDNDLSKTLDFLTTGVFQFAHSKPKQGTYPNWYLGTRPGSKLKMIVRIPAKYFDALKITELGLSNFSAAPATISFLTCNLSEKIKKATTVMKVFQQELEKWNGTIEYLDLSQEIKRLQSFPFVIQKFIQENGYTFSAENEDEIEIGIVPNDYSVLYVEYITAGAPIRMRQCFNRFVMQEPIKYPRTINYLANLDEIIQLGKTANTNNNGWYTLATELTFPVPLIKSKSIAAAGETINEKTAGNIADKLDLVDTLTLAAKRLQDSQLGDEELKIKLAENRAKQKDFAGDAFVAALPELIDILCNLPRDESGLQEVFNLVFDKIDIPKLASFGASSLMKSMSFTDMEFSVALASLDSPDFGELKLKSFSACLPANVAEKVDKAQSFMNGDIGIEDIADIDDNVKEKLLDYFDANSLQLSTTDKPNQKPASAAKYSTMPVSDAECLTEKQPQKYPSNKNTLSKDSNQLLDLIKMLATEEELVSCCKDSIPDIFDSVQNKVTSVLDNTKNFKMPDLDGFGNSNLGLDLNLSDISIPSVKMPKPPTFPDFSFSLEAIDDTMKGITQELNSGMSQTFAEIVIDISCELLQVVFDEIFSTSSDITTNGTDGYQISYGKEDMNDLITNFDNAVQMFKSFGVPEEVLADNDPKQILSQVSEAITPLEVVDLLEGNPKRETLKAVENKMQEIDPRLLRGVDRNTSVESLFRNLGKLSSPQGLENIRTLSTRILPNISGLLCEDEKAARPGESRRDQARREVLEEKLDEECVDRQIEEERRVNKEKLAELLSYANGADVLDGKVPNALDNCGATAKTNSNNVSIPTSGFINKNHPTIDYLNDKIIKAVFDPIKMNFSAEANSVVDVYSESDFRYPTEFEDNYAVLEQKLGMNGLEAGDIIAGIAGSLDADAQSKFEDIAAPLRRLDTKVAPRIRQQLETKTTELIEQQVEAETNQQFKFAIIAEEITATEKQKKLNSLNAELSNLKSQFTDLETKIAKAENNLSLPFSIDLPDFKNEKNSVKDQIVLLEDEIGTLLQDSQADPNSLQTGKATEKEFPFYHYSNAYINQETSSPIKDGWVYIFENDTASGVLDNSLNRNVIDGTVTLVGTDNISEEVSELATDYTFYPSINQRDQVFSNYMRQKWQQVDSNYAVDISKDSDFFNFFREKRPLYFKSLINIIGSQVSTSDVFNPEKLAGLELGEKIQLSKDKCDNLLGLENLKEEAKKQYNNTCDDNRSPSSPGAIEESNLVNLMRASIRVSIIQMVSEAIFLFSKFGFEKILEDPAAAQFALNYVISDLNRQDIEFYDEFVYQAQLAIEKRKQNGEKLVDPFGTSDEEDPLIETADDSAEDKNNYLQYMIKEEIKKIAPLIDKKIMSPAIDINDLFLDTIVPVVNVPRHKDENRFEILIDTEQAGDDGKVSQPQSKFKFLSPNDPLFEGAGGFVLERYIRVEDADITEDLDTLNESEKAFATAWFSRPGGKNNETADATALESINLNNDLVDQFSGFAHTSGVVNKEALLQVISEISEQNDIDPLLIDFSKFVKKFQYGLRIVYIPPTNKDSFKITETDSLNAAIADVTGVNIEDSQNIEYYNLIITNDEISAAKNAQQNENFDTVNFEKVFNNSIQITNGNKQAALNNMARKEKAYFLTETLGVLESSEEFDGSGVALSILAGDPLTTGTETVGTLTAQTTNLYPVPVVTMEKDLGIFDAIKNDEGIVTLDSLFSSLSSQVVTDAAYSALKSEMKKSKEYKLLFDYDIPLKRLVTSLVIYNVAASVKNYPRVKNAYDETKSLIRSNFFNMIPGDPWWSKQDKKIEEAGGNAGLMADANNSMTIDGPSNSAMAAKIAAKALVIILKAYARQTDPNYKLMSFLDGFGLTIDGMTWLSVPALYPVNFPPLPTPFGPIPGWGPPMTPTGMLAYSLPLLPGEVKKRKQAKKEQGQEIEDSSCADNETE